MRVIGVTGGIGAGKSTVLQYLETAYQARVIQADLVGHEVMKPEEKAWEEILTVFGSRVQAPDGSIDRRILGGIVFSDEGKRKALNAIVHPAVKQEILRRIRKAVTEGVPCVAVEAALFFEEKYDAFCEETWYIYTKEEKRRRRLKASRGYTDERIEQIFKSQKTHEEFLSRCDYVIDNNRTAEDTCRQIDKRMKR